MTKIEKVRLDATPNGELMALARAGADAFGYCLTVHHPAARRAGIAQSKIDTLTAWWETRLFSDAERAALDEGAMPTDGTTAEPSTALGES
jgi:AhpD family alkylhydroperoxidase